MSIIEYLTIKYLIQELIEEKIIKSTDDISSIELNGKELYIKNKQPLEYCSLTIEIKE